jgi:hypothetical protein
MAATMPTEALFDVDSMILLLMVQLDLDDIDELRDLHRFSNPCGFTDMGQ